MRPGRDLRIDPLSYNSIQDHLCQERDEEAGALIFIPKEGDQEWLKYYVEREGCQ